MALQPRVLPNKPFASLADYIAAGGGCGLKIARKLGPSAVIRELEESGLRGRGGAGFPTGTKWRTVAGFASARTPTTVVVNGAEGEPGTFKDRAILRANPFAVIEGALVAALAVRADRVVITIKETFAIERTRLEDAIAEVREAGWCEGVVLAVAVGPPAYLFGEETALLEVLDGRPPFPRVAPPYRHGVDEMGPDPDEPAGTWMAGPGGDGPPPTLVDNVETVAHVAAIAAEGPKWFRQVGSPDSPGTIVCTVSGATDHHGVAEVALGTPLGDVIDQVGGGPLPERHLVAAMSGVANPLVPAEQFGTRLTYEDMAAIGSGLGACGFIVFDDATDLAAVAAGVSRFLAVESCGQCTPCKRDGLVLAELLARVARSEADEDDLAGIADRCSTVADGARCFLAQQHQRVVESVLGLFPSALQAHVRGHATVAEPEPIVPIRDLGEDGRFTLELGELEKQPDWSYEDTDSGQAPADRFTHLDQVS